MIAGNWRDDPGRPSRQIYARTPLGGTDRQGEALDPPGCRARRKFGMRRSPMPDYSFTDNDGNQVPININD